MDLCNSLTLLCCWCCDRKDPDEKAYDYDERVKKASQMQPLDEQPPPVQNPGAESTKLQQTVEVQREEQQRGAERGGVIS